MEQQGTMQAFIAEHGITIESSLIGTVTEDGGEYNVTMTAWTVTVTMGGATFVTPWRQGLRVEGEPRLANVLSAMASDASSVLNADGFEDWAGEYGYDLDSRRAEAIYRDVEAQTARFEEFLGADAFRVLVWETDQE